MAKLLKLSPSAIVEAFPDEAKELVPHHIRKMGHDIEIKMVKGWINRIKHQGFHPLEEKLLWDMFYMLLPGTTKKKLENIENLKSMQRLMSKDYSDGRINDADIEAAKDVPIWNLIEMKKSGRRYVSSCPLPSHMGSDKTPSFNVYGKKFKCYGCGRFGDTIQFAMEWKSLKFGEAVKWLISSYHPQRKS